MTTTMTPKRAEQIADLYSVPLLFLGISLTVIGIIAILSSFLFTIGAVLVLGGLLLAAGIVESIQAFKMARKHNKKVLLNVLSALAYVVAGVVMLSYPVAGALSLTLLISCFLLANGLINLNLAYGIHHREELRSGWFVFGGIVDLILGGLILLGWPVTALWVIGLFIGVEMLIYGCAWIAISFAVREFELPQETN